MSLASVGIVTASLIVFGFFIIFSLNISQNADDSLQRQAEIEVFCNHNWDDAQAVQVEEAIKKNDDVKKYRKVSKREALERAKDMLGDDRGVLDGYDNDYSFMPISFIVELNDPYKSAEIVNEFWKINGVEDISYQEAAVDFIQCCLLG
jgi:cell division transport system permease protein